MDVSASLAAPCEPAALFGWVDDLARYPAWLDIVPRAVADERRDGDPGPAWVIHLRGRFGPMSRSKRLRMVRTVCEPDRRVVFERREADGQDHAAWVLTAEIEPTDAGASLTMGLHYGGRLFEELVERLLRHEIEAARVRLLTLLAGASPA